MTNTKPIAMMMKQETVTKLVIPATSFPRPCAVSTMKTNVKLSKDAKLKCMGDYCICVICHKLFRD